MTEHVISDCSGVEAALGDPDLVPPSRAGDGDALALRAAMARFSRPAEHPGRRRAVVAAVESIDPTELRDVARKRTSLRLAGARIDAIAAIAGVVPTEALATCLCAGAPLDEVVADVDAMVAVIGRGEPSAPEADVAVRRLIERFGVPGASLLYQNRDATAAAITTRMAAAATGRAAAPPVPRTVRVGPDGSVTVLEIGAAGLPFGAGPHRCPGEHLAEAIVAGVLDAVAAAHYAPAAAGIEYDDDGRPTALTLVSVEQY